LSESIALNDKNSFSYCKRGQCFLQLFEWIKAVDDATKSIELDGGRTDAYEIASIAYEHLVDYESAYGVLLQGSEYINKNKRTIVDSEKILWQFKQWMDEVEKKIIKIEK
jgi:hypothetical protein